MTRRTIGYWTTTAIIAFVFLSGGGAYVLRVPEPLHGMAELGYPAYVVVMLGVWKLLGGVTILAPKFPRLKEWAYAGITFDLTGAAASQGASGHGVVKVIGPLIILGIAAMSYALRPSSRRLAAPVSSITSSQRRTGWQWAGLIGYWLTTANIAWELSLGGAWDVLRVPYVSGVIAHLGYPSYFLVILGVWKMPGALALVVPRFPRLKEWAYAGAFFNYFGAAVSHLSVGDGPKIWVGPAVFAGMLMVSWALRPASRRFVVSPSSGAPSIGTRTSD